MAKINYSDEQLQFIECAKKGENVLVDACIGSGKTTAIQGLCNELDGKSILYLTYNKLLKLDAKAKIRNLNVTVQNYHGFAYIELKRKGIKSSIGELIKTYNRIKPKCKTKYDVLILDEYQDIDEEISKMLTIIKSMFPKIQIIAVGDMEQKIYDYTSLDVKNFIDSFLGNHKQMSFSRCFRLGKDYAKKLGDAWNKPIIGVNDVCRIECMDKTSIIALLSKCEPRDILCLGARYGDMVDVLNELETKMRNKFNKYTVYASISDRDKGRVDPRDDVAIFTTFDSSKGLERKVCVVFDFDDAYWEIRKNQPNVKYNILRNIFLVAASRGKERIIFCTGDKTHLEFSTIAEAFETSEDFSKYPYNISTMFEYKYIEDIVRAFNDLDVTKIDMDDTKAMHVKQTDGLIDMSPCIGIFTQACYFENYNIDNQIRFQLSCDYKMYNEQDMKDLTFADKLKKIRYSVYLSTKQRRYYTQSRNAFVTEEDESIIRERLSTILPPDAEMQKTCSLPCMYYNDEGEEKIIDIRGMTGAIHDGIIYDLKFVGDLSPQHYLSLATYMLAFGSDVGRLWNIRNNDLYEVRIKDKKQLLDHIIQIITKGTITEFIDARERIEQPVGKDELDSLCVKESEWFNIYDESLNLDKEN
jgi:hypothetical protein